MTTQLNFSVSEQLDAETDKPIHYGTFSREWSEEEELDKLLDRAATASAPAPAPATLAAKPAAPSHYRKHPDFEDSDYRGAQHYPRDRKKSWLSEIFD